MASPRPSAVSCSTKSSCRRPCAAPSAKCRCNASFPGAVTITLGSATDGASIGYTLEPGDDAHWLLYTAPIRLDHSATLRVRAIRYGFAESAETQAIFISGANHHVENHGKLFGSDGIRSAGANGVIENTGMIMASDTGVVATGPHRVINSGEIHGGQYGIAGCRQRRHS